MVCTSCVDRILLPGRLNEKTFDPEGILSTLPAIVTALLGMFTDRLVQLPNERLSGNKKVLYMLLTAVVCIVVGCIWGYWFPINKKLWTSTFVLVVAGYSLIMFALFYYIIDVKGYYKWSFFFRVIGLNSITIYIAQRIINFRQISDFFLGGIASKCPEDVGKLIISTGFIAACWLFLYVLYKKNIFLKV
jgi:predicted acyltransferase